MGALSIRPPSPPPTPRDAHVLGRRGEAHSSVCVFVCGLEAAEQTCMCEVLLDTASLRTSAFVSLNSLFLTVFYYCCFLILFEYFHSYVQKSY